MIAAAGMLWVGIALILGMSVLLALLVGFHLVGIRFLNRAHTRRRLRRYVRDNRSLREVARLHREERLKGGSNESE